MGVAKRLKPLFLSNRGVLDKRGQDLRLGLCFLPFLLPHSLIGIGRSRLGPGGLFPLEFGQLLRLFALPLELLLRFPLARVLAGGASPACIVKRTRLNGGCVILRRIAGRGD